MTFSQSFGFGSSTFMKLESEVNHAINDESVKEVLLDVILESPPPTSSYKPSALSLTRSKSRVLPITTQSYKSESSTNHRKFRRSKSDSLLQKPAAQNIPNASDDYSQFFQSDFSIQHDISNNKQNSIGNKNASVLRVSQIETALKNFSDIADIRREDTDNNASNSLEKPIFSEDLKGILETDGNSSVWEDSLPLLTEAKNGEKTEEDPLEMLHEISSFICLPKDDTLREQLLKKELNASRRFFKQCKLSESSSERNVSLSCMSPEQLKFSEEICDSIPNGKIKSIESNADENLNKDIDYMTEKSTQIRSKYAETKSIENSTNILQKLKSIEAWNLPLSVLKEYEKKAVTEMFDWQVECLSNPKVLFEHCNLVYSAPTSAGKTLVSEILLLKTVLERGKKVLIILPFISVVREKMLYLQDLLTAAGYRVEGFFGGYTPPGGFESINVAICTIEKANSIVNKLLEQGKLNEIGTVVVDEVHLISDPGRGYILELLLAKILYMSRKYALQIQIITMSATLANVELLKKWLDAELYITNFRPVALQEMIKIGNKIYDNCFNVLRLVTETSAIVKEPFPILQNDSDHVAQLCIETLVDGCSVIVFCPSKDWCENLATQLAGTIHSLGKRGDEWGIRLRDHINRQAIDSIKQQLREIPTGLDAVLEKCITYGSAFHHAGLTTEERDIVEAGFKSGALKIIVATSTLSSGVNLPARRVLIRSPLFGGKQMNSLTYRQMIGRAGRTGKDILGESILICTESNARVGKELITADLKPISSCLDLDSSTHLKRALLEVISSGVATSKQDIDDFVNCTLLSVEKQLVAKQKEQNLNETTKREYISGALDFLIEYEFIRLQTNEESHEQYYVATRLGNACLASSMPPTDGLILFAELQKSRRCFVLESELHAVYLVTPYSVCYQLQDLDWLLFLDLWEKLTPAMKKVGELVGVKESFLVRAMRGQTKLDYKLMQIHKRFYTALALQELVNEVPINQVASKYKCTRGMLQSLQQMSSTFAGIVTSFCNSLQWNTLSLIVSQFKERLYFGIHRDLIDLMRLPDLNHKRARILYDAGITSLVELATANSLHLEQILYNALSFDLVKKQENENDFEAAQRNEARNFFITGKAGITVSEAAKLLIQEARRFVQYEIGVDNINWSQSACRKNSPVRIDKNEMHMSYEENKYQNALSECNLNPAMDQFANKENISPKLKMSKVIDSFETGKEDNSSNKNSKIRKSTIQDMEMPPSTLASVLPTPTDSEEKPSTSKKAQRLLKAKQLSAIKKQERAERIDLQQYQSVNETETTTTILNEKSKTPEVINKNVILKKSANVSNTSQSPNEAILPRRSPRNYLQSSSGKEETSKAKEGKNNLRKSKNDVFKNENKESPKINANIIEVFNEKNKSRKSAITECKNNSLEDEIPSSQQLIDEMPLIKSNLFQGSRFLRSSLRATQKILSPKTKPLPEAIKLQIPNNIELTSSTSIEISDVALENSIIKHPLQLNASHILSCSKVDTDSSSFKSLDIIDICGDQQLFKEAFKEMMSHKRLGFCLGIQQQCEKRKPIIGANLLLNQVAASEREKKHTICYEFRIDDINYLAGVAFCISENVVYYMNMQQEGSCRGLTDEVKCKYLSKLLRSADHTLLIYDAKEQMKILYKIFKNIGEILIAVEDPKVANWLLQPDKNHNLHSLAQQFAPECSSLVNLCGGGRGYNSYGLDSESAILAKVRSSIEACVTIHILKGQIENLERIGTGQLQKFFTVSLISRLELEMPLQKSLCNMEVLGFPTSSEALNKLFQQIVDCMKKIETKIYEMHGSRFNLGSSSAIAKVVGLHRKSNGRISTSKQILEKIDSPISQMIIVYRKLSVTLTKNIQPLLKCVKDERIHGQSITFTSTGRISMTEPNLQNVSKDFEIVIDSEKQIISCRSAFFPSDTKRCLISSDFCQLEMRILAHLSQDPALLHVMRSDNDIFVAIAARWNKISENSVTEQLRNGTKQICYGIVYGMGMRALAESLKCTEEEAKLVSEQFHAAYPGIRTYTEKVIKFARNNGYIETITGRRRYLENINNEEALIRNQAERQAVNSTIQGSAADIAKSAILRMEKNILKYRDKLGLEPNSVRLVLHLHDELIFEVPTEKAKKIAKVLSLTMENCVKLNVPLTVKLKIGKSWGELKEI